ncbi:hypothetical protein AB0X79_08155 [Pediococcus pentosaceus]|uniref:hypothetical protein n=1 Tax=Pediococcus pentosaceus TaxID=1255 RepID=UPI003F268D6F
MTNLINFLDNRYNPTKEELLMDCEDFLMDNGKFLSSDDIEELKARGVSTLEMVGLQTIMLREVTRNEPMNTYFVSLQELEDLAYKNNSLPYDEFRELEDWAEFQPTEKLYMLTSGQLYQ